MRVGSGEGRAGGDSSSISGPFGDIHAGRMLGGERPECYGPRDAPRVDAGDTFRWSCLCRNSRRDLHMTRKHPLTDTALPPLGVSVPPPSSVSPARRRQAIVALSVLVVFWGLTFPLNKMAMAAIDAVRDAHNVGMAQGFGDFTPLLFSAVRFGVVALMFPFVFPRVFRLTNPRAIMHGFMLGVVFVGGFVTQSYGLARTTPAVSAFLTSLYMPLTPVVLFMMTRQRPSRALLAGMAVAVAGVAILTKPWTALMASAGGMTFGAGELFGLACAMFFAVHIVITDRCTKLEDPITLAWWMLIFATVGCSVPIGFFTGAEALSDGEVLGAMLAHPRATIPLAIVIVTGTLLAFPLMNTNQRYLDPSQAGIVYAFEPIWASLFSVLAAATVGLAGADSLSVALLIGGVLLLGGNVIAELPHRRRVKRADDSAGA